MGVTVKLQKEKHFTYADYVEWDDDVRYELIDGVAYALSAPLQVHQRVLRELTGLLWTFLKGKKCELFMAPADVRLSYDTTDDTVVQPDLFVVCDKSKLDGKACIGAPDLVIEILSPSTARIDMLKKFHAYLKAEVLEYWIVDPEGKTIDVFKLENGEYVGSEYIKDAVVKSHVLEGCEIKLVDVFEE